MSDTALVPYNDMQNMAKAIATSGLFGIRTPEQALALMLIAQAEGLHPAVAARDYDIIQGRPAKKSEAMMRSFIQAGGSVQWHELSDTKAEATFSHPQGGTVKLDWTMERAKKAGLETKDMYKKYPRQMLRARVISEGVRTVCPLATSGLYVPEEVMDFENNGEPININSRRRTGHGWSRAELPEAPAEQESPAPGAGAPGSQTRVEPQGAGDVFKRIETAASVEALNQIGVELQTAPLSDDDKKTARKLFAARKKQLAERAEI